MPKQYVVFGRPVPRWISRRMPLILIGFGIFALFSLFVTLPSSIPTGPSLSKFADHKFSIPKFKDKFSSSILNPFRQASHPPPVQKNSTDGESSWYSNWNWLSPFSSSVTLDENRSLLPPLKERARIYCYYDTTIERDAILKEAESDLLLTWRRAWWAQGLKPIILTAAEAMHNPLYDELQRLEMEPGLKTDMMRWLAWETMGGGLLAHHLLFPMGSHEDPTLTFLRRGEFPGLTRWEGFDNALFAGTKTEIASAIAAALRGPQRKTAKDVISAAPTDTFAVDPTHDGLAFYDAKTLEKKYKPVADEFTRDRSTGLKALNALITSHLHTIWQDTFTGGIAVLKPLQEHSTHMVGNALLLAQWLANCANTPIPASCPPNVPKCSPCVASHPMKISTPKWYRNTTTIYNIGSVPHPYTIATLNAQRERLDIPWIRRESERDIWLSALFQHLLGTGVSGGPRIIAFKDAVAGGFASAHSLWLTAEHETLPEDLDWHFGFQIPRNGTDQGKSETPIPGPERRPKAPLDPANGPLPSDDDYAREVDLMKLARGMGKSKKEEDLKVRSAIEAWNLADTEAWKFARAYLARSRVERRKWEEEESRYAGGVGIEKVQGKDWGRWD